MIVTLIIVPSNVILYYCITFDFRIRRKGCKIRTSTKVSGHRGHRHCLCDSPAYGCAENAGRENAGPENGGPSRNAASLCS